MRELVNISNRTLEEQLEFNDKLFALYAKLVGPLTALDNLYKFKNDNEKQIKKLQHLNLNCGGLFIYGLMMFMYYIIYILVMWTVSFRYDLKDEIVRWGWWIILVTTTFLVLFIENKIRTNKRKKLEKELRTINNQIADIYNIHKEQFQFIPSSYFNCNAVAYFAQAYRDGKVSNLKEAMESYDLYLHRKIMETGQIQMINQQQQILNNQRAMRQEMAFDTAMLLLSKF